MSFTKEMIFQYTWKLNTENHLVFLSFHEESVSAAPKKEKKRKEKREREREREREGQKEKESFIWGSSIWPCRDTGLNKNRGNLPQERVGGLES